jgi:hypothetical protein
LKFFTRETSQVIENKNLVGTGFTLERSTGRVVHGMQAAYTSHKPRSSFSNTCPSACTTGLRAATTVFAEPDQ